MRKILSKISNDPPAGARAFDLPSGAKILSAVVQSFSILVHVATERQSDFAKWIVNNEGVVCVTNAAKPMAAALRA